MNQGKNKYYTPSHIWEPKFGQLIQCCALDLNAFEAHKITHISYPSCKVIYSKLGLYIVKFFCQNYCDCPEFECDQSYFGPRGIGGKRGCGAAGKPPVFGLLKRGRKVYVQIVKNCSKSELMPIIQGKILEGSRYIQMGEKPMRA